ncbi:hypothetical protein ACI76Q_09810 [Capnocytophaga canimorsus]|uniref:hypothetical protein n=1 Tax=Capnocytophaga canimorsus TaxID=28188 RepID=UPI0005A4F1C6|nr:hypothetical protein [Capnocytophaga canimorsus]VEJ18345.1 Uncharacterised protein [Capnocytophaga canimorsus]
MRFLEITGSLDHKITGVNDASSQVETFYKNDLQSLTFKEKQYLENFCRNCFQNEKGIYFDDFQRINLPLITLYKSKKRVKETDILAVLVQNSFGLFQYAFSEKALTILEKYQLPAYEKIKVLIPEFQNKYYLVRFSEIPIKKIDFQKSIFFKPFVGRLKVENYEQYRQQRLSIFQVYLQIQYPYEVALLGNHLFFSEKIIKEFESQSLTGYEITERVMLPMEK